MDPSHKKIEKRNRAPVSCEPCRSRKLKCNRALPCDACIRKDEPSTCYYAANASRKKAPVSNKARELKDRLNNLESLLSSILAGGTVIQTVTPGAGSDAPINNNNNNNNSAVFPQARSLSPRTSEQDSGLGSTHGRDEVLVSESPHLHEKDDGQRNYVDSSHWLSILDDIKEIREHISVVNNPFPRSERPTDANQIVTDPGLVFPGTQHSSREAILDSLPPQPVCDMLLSWYFNARFMILGIIHPMKFQEEYTAFRDSPTSTSLVWIALLFSILSVAATLRRMAGMKEVEGSIPPIQILQQRTMQCLLLGRYASANSHVLEALILHLQSCFLGAGFQTLDPWLAMGTIIRIAFRMGYHRDPDGLADVSPFDGEMRRRVWINVFQLDALLSFQMGFPSMIPTEFCDAKLPRNLENLDLTVDMKALPPSRPLSESTPLLYSIVKASIMAVFKKIVAHTQSLTPPTYDATLQLDAEMNKAYQDVPPLLQGRSVARSLIDPTVVIWQRCTIEVLYLKGLIVLHRRYVHQDPQSQRFGRSRRTCIEAALGVLARTADLHDACEPGGRLYDERYMFQTLHAHDFLLAAMVVCLDLSTPMRMRVRADKDHDLRQLEDREYRALQTSQRIWARGGEASHEAHVAALALELMIKKVGENDLGLGFDEVSSDLAELPYAGSMAQMIDGSEIIDWSLLDQYFHNMDYSLPDNNMRP